MFLILTISEGLCVLCPTSEATATAGLSANRRSKPPLSLCSGPPNPVAPTPSCPIASHHAALASGARPVSATSARAEGWQCRDRMRGSRRRHERDGGRVRLAVSIDCAAGAECFEIAVHAWLTDGEGRGQGIGGGQGPSFFFLCVF